MEKAIAGLKYWEIGVWGVFRSSGAGREEEGDGKVYILIDECSS